MNDSTEKIVAEVDEQFDKMVAEEEAENGILANLNQLKLYQTKLTQQLNIAALDSNYSSLQFRLMFVQLSELTKTLTTLTKDSPDG